MVPKNLDEPVRICFYSMALTADERRLWLALHLTPGLGSTLFRRLMTHFGSPRDVFKARLEEIAAVHGVSKAMARRISGRQHDADPEGELRKAEQIGARVLCFPDEAYPESLRQIHNPPMVLYIKGVDIPQDALLFAMVGSRNPTDYGLRSAERLAAGLSARGAWVVSGLARGIDAAAHWGAVLGGGSTVAVLGTGIDCIYPSENEDLSRRITEKGCLVSEFPLGTHPEPRNFPIRNRIISGLSKGVVVVEAARKSGSLITASAALEQGRDVFAVPGSISSFASVGTHQLIKQGAKLVEHAEDVLEEYGWIGSVRTRPAEPESPPADLSGPERVVYERLGDYPLHLDEIVRGAGGLDAGTVAGILLKLELQGLVRQHQGKMFTREV
jgi:DNA processing protein